MSQADPSDWEDWDPSQGNFLHHMVAGSIAGITEHTAMYPVDTFKTYVQCMRECPESVAGRRVMEMVRGQGMLRMWRGVGTMFTGCVPAHALYFSVLEHCKVRETSENDMKYLELTEAGARCSKVCTEHHGGRTWAYPHLDASLMVVKIPVYDPFGNVCHTPDFSSA